MRSSLLRAVLAAGPVVFVLAGGPVAAAVAPASEPAVPGSTTPDVTVPVTTVPVTTVPVTTVPATGPVTTGALPSVTWQSPVLCAAPGAGPDACVTRTAATLTAPSGAVRAVFTTTLAAVPDPSTGAAATSGPAPSCVRVVVDLSQRTLCLPATTPAPAPIDLPTGARVELEVRHLSGPAVRAAVVIQWLRSRTDTTVPPGGLAPGATTLPPGVTTAPSTTSPATSPATLPGGVVPIPLPAGRTTLVPVSRTTGPPLGTDRPRSGEAGGLLPGEPAAPPRTDDGFASVTTAPVPATTFAPLTTSPLTTSPVVPPSRPVFATDVTRPPVTTVPLGSGAEEAPAPDDLVTRVALGVLVLAVAGVVLLVAVQRRG